MEKEDVRRDDGLGVDRIRIVIAEGVENIWET